MSVAAADLHSAINTAWNASGLDATFRALWPAEYAAADFPVLHDQEAAPGQPFPYCVMGESGSSTQVRMSSEVHEKREVRDIAWMFTVHSNAIDGDARTSKEIASDLIEEIMKQFGGHPTVVPAQPITLVNGKHLITQYVNDAGIRTGDDEYSWFVSYIFRIDVPVAV